MKRAFEVKNKKQPFLVSKVFFFRHSKQISKNVADTNCNIRNLKIYLTQLFQGFGMHLCKMSKYTTKL